MGWLYFVIGVIAWPVIKSVILVINQAIIDRRKKKFLNLVNIKFPDRTEIAFVAIDSSDKRSMQKLERELRDYYEIPEDDAIVYSQKPHEDDTDD